MPELATLRVMADYGSSGIWVEGANGPFRHGMISHSKLELPDEIARDFREWIEGSWSYKSWDVDAMETFNQRGRALAVRLKAFVGPAFTVVFQPEVWPSGIGSEELIE